MQALLIYLVISLVLDVAAGQVTGTGSVTGLAIGTVESVVWWALGLAEVNYVRQFARDIALNELEKAAHEAFEQHTEDDEQTARRERALARQNPNTTFLYGEVSVEDLALFVGGTTVFAVAPITETPFHWAADLAFEITGFRG
jgi:hypothetical protein